MYIQSLLWHQVDFACLSLGVLPEWTRQWGSLLASNLEACEEYCHTFQPRLGNKKEALKNKQTKQNKIEKEKLVLTELCTNGVKIVRSGPNLKRESASSTGISGPVYPCSKAYHGKRL